jgi:hypothetical protein
MPQIRVAMWNIQNFGGANQNNSRGVNNQLLANVIRDLVRYLQIDILMIMEVLPAAGPSLQAVVNTLNAGIPGGNADWRYDWIKGSIATGSPLPPVSPATTSWRGGPGSPRVEGYAFFWRSNQPAKYTLVPARNNASEGSFPGAVGHYLELITQGLDFDYVDDQHWWVTSGYNPATHQTLPIDNNQAALTWQPLNFPWVNIGMFAEPRVFQSRRPAFAILNLNIAGAAQADRLLPLIFYHAPSNRTRAQIGTFSAALSRQINVANQLDMAGNQTAALNRVNQAVIGGDFNWNRPAPVDFTYAKFVDPYQNNVLNGGSNLAFNTLPHDATTVQIRELENGRFNGPQITTNVNADYYYSPIDQLMFRGLANVPAATGSVNMMQLLQNAPYSPFRASMAAYRLHFQTMINNSAWHADGTLGPLDGPVGLPVFGLRFTDWNNFYANLGRNNGTRRFTTARSAAELMHIFVSDHVPLVLTFNI